MTDIKPPAPLDASEAERAQARNPPPWLHIRPQNWNHDSAEIVGTRAGLSALRDAISVALEVGESEASAIANDGEGYGVRIRRSRTVAGLGRPYYARDVASELARSEFNFLLSHKRLLDKQNEEAIKALRWSRENGNPHAAHEINRLRAEANQGERRDA